MSKKGLTILPPEIGQLTNLQTLNLSGNQLTVVPPEIGQLTNLQTLDFSGNQLTVVPLEIGQLTNLETLEVSENQLTVVPPQVGQLINLRTLDLSSIELTVLPPEIGKLTNLQILDLWINQLMVLPPEIGQLTNLQALDLWYNQLAVLPPEMGQLTNLRTLDLSDNLLMVLPLEMGQLTNLRDLDLGRNILTDPPTGLVEQGTEAILAYLRRRTEGEERHWVSKLLLVGEGWVGKSQLIRVLRGEKFVDGSSRTEGIEISVNDPTKVGVLELAHPSDTDVTMKFSSWDFGGQDVYHATRQFFLAEQSLYLLVWNARYGWEQGKLYYWLDAIQVKAPDSPVLKVAAHIDENPAPIPFQDLQRRYPQIVGSWEVSNKTGQGIDELRKVIRNLGPDLPLMGEHWPDTWLKAAEAVRRLPEKYISSNKLWQVMANNGVTDADAGYLARWMHNLGEILFYQEDQGLADMVVLDPQWAISYIYKALDSKEIEQPLGLFKRSLMKEVWKDLDNQLHDHFLRLMERFDLSYKTLQEPDISIVVERLSEDPPEDVEPAWEQFGTGSGIPDEISMRFDLNTTVPAGVPTWFIARQHRFTTKKHWKYGALFADDPDLPKHLARVQSFPHERYLELSVRGPYPQNFLALLRDDLEVTLARFEGLKDTIRRTVPCKGHNGQDCSFRFDYRNLEGALERTPPRLDIQCQESLEMVSVLELMYGLHWRTQTDVMVRIDALELEMKAAIAASQGPVLDELKILRSLLQRQFIIEKSKIDSRCPRVFALVPASGARWLKNLMGQKKVLHLYCEQPGEWHPTEQGGTYEIPQPPEWIADISPYLGGLMLVLRRSAPVVAPLANIAAPGVGQLITKHINFMDQLVNKLPSIEGTEGHRYLRDIAEGGTGGEHTSGVALRMLRQLLEEKDPKQVWGGLRKVITPEGHYLWLCENHAREYR